MTARAAASNDHRHPSRWRIQGKNNVSIQTDSNHPNMPIPATLPGRAFFPFGITGLIITILLITCSQDLTAQLDLPDGIHATARGTGRTTGHIADLTLHNSTTLPHLLAPSPIYIPATGKYQPYILPETPGIAIPANGTITVPLEGYCADIHKKPVPLGIPLIPVEEWIKPQPLPHSWTPQHALGWHDVRNSPLLIPGTDQPLGHTLDINAHPEEAAPLLLDAILKITTATDRMRHEGLISTPFSGDPDKEREAIIQQTFWIYTSALSGDTYTRSQFTEQTHEQFETNTGRPVSSLKEEQQEELDAGIASFWESFQATGAEAKIIRQDPGIVFQERPASDTPQCDCDSLSLSVRILDGGREVGTAAMTVTRFTQKAQDLDITDPTVNEGDDLRVEISGITMHCSCSETAECTAYPPKRTGGPDTEKTGQIQIRTGENEAQVTNDNFQCLITNQLDDRWNDDGTTYTMDLHFAKYGKHDSDPFQCIQLTAWCAGEECRRNRCNQKICLRFSWPTK